MDPEACDSRIPDLGGRFRDTMARVAAAVVVVTAIDEQGPHGTTVSAFSSLSVSPPMILVALDNNSELLGIIRRTGRFGINILNESQADMATAFARKGRGKFSGFAWTEDHAVPRLPDTTGWFACATSALVPGGDHHIALGTVLHAEPGTTAVPPLTYHQRTYGTHVPTVGRVTTASA